MKIQEMLETITSIEKHRNVIVYIHYISEFGWKFVMYRKSSKSDLGLSRTIPPNQIAVWNIDILKRFLESMADAAEIGVNF